MFLLDFSTKSFSLKSYENHPRRGSGSISLVFSGMLTVPAVGVETDCTSSESDNDCGDVRVSFLSRMQLVNLQTTDAELTLLKANLLEHFPCNEFF